MLNLYDLETNNRYSFTAKVKSFTTDKIHPTIGGYRTPNYWNKKRIILKDVKILDNEKFVDFEPEIKMDCGKQFQTINVNDLISFNARVGFINPYYNGYDIDYRGCYQLTIDLREPYGRWYTYSEKIGTKEEIDEMVEEIKETISEFKSNKSRMRKSKLYNVYGYEDIDYNYECIMVRRLISPSKLKIISEN